MAQKPTKARNPRKRILVPGKDRGKAATSAKDEPVPDVTVGPAPPTARTTKAKTKHQAQTYVDPNDPTAAPDRPEIEDAKNLKNMAQEQPDHEQHTTYNKRGNTAQAKLSKPKTTAGPRAFTHQLADSICHRISCGETLTAICRDKDMPAHGTVMGWVRQRRDFSASYAQARKHQQDAWADQNIDIADFSTGDYARLPTGEYQLDRDGNPVFLKEAPQRAKLKIEARQWTMQRVNRESYGERIGVDMTGDVTTKSDAELIADLAQAMDAAGMAADDLMGLVDAGRPKTPQNGAK